MTRQRWLIGTSPGGGADAALPRGRARRAALVPWAGAPRWCPRPEGGVPQREIAPKAPTLPEPAAPGEKHPYSKHRLQPE